jgi:hypothetical protein
MSKQMQTAVADLKELLSDTKFISHPYTNSHVNETRRRGFRIGASLVGEERSRYLALLDVGMTSVAGVQVRNSQEVLQPNSFVGVAGVESTTLRWEDNLESLEYALASHGLTSVRDGDDGVVVEAQVKTAPDNIYLKLKATSTLDLRGVQKRVACRAVAGTFLEQHIAQGTAELDRDEMQLFLELLDEHPEGQDVRASILEDLNIPGVA